MNPPETFAPTSLADLRSEYARETLDEKAVDTDPLRQFQLWMQEAIRAQALEPTAMTLATVEAGGRPSARTMLLKGVDPRGFVFFTNYSSRKGKALAEHPLAAITFFWRELERQVRVEGAVEKVAPEESQAYFATRPLGSRIGAWASPQSEPIESRLWLESRWAELTDRLGDNPPCPPHWGGYRLLPDYLEFWQGRVSRLHDRVVYRRSAQGWKIVRIAP